MSKSREVNLKLVVFLVLFLMLTFSLIRAIKKEQAVKKRIAKVNQRIAKIEKENEALEAELKKITSDSFLEKQLRDKLGFAKEGEIVVVLPEEAVVKRLAPRIPEEEDSLPLPTWKKWLKLFDVNL